MNQQNFSTGWDEEGVRKILVHYEEQTEQEATAEDEDILRIVESEQEAEQ